MSSTAPAARRLVAIMIADTVGFSRLMEQDESGTFARLRSLRDEIALPGVAAEAGTVIKTTGDGFLAEFPSAHAAMRAAIAIQRAMLAREVATPPETRIRLRIGVHLGDILADGDDIAGDGVNIAARLEPLAPADGICISAAVREQIRDDLGVVFEDAGDLQLKNIARTVRAYRVRLGTGGPPVKSPEGANAMTDTKAAVHGFADRPAIAVLPFDNMSNDAEQAYFADGIAEDILTRLALCRWIPVIARNSSFVYRGKAVDLKAVGAALGARYILEGSVRKAADRVRVTAQLIEAESGHHVWAERYDRVLSDIFELQDEITNAVVGALEPAVGRAERARNQHRPTTDLNAWELYQRGCSRFGLLTRESLAQTKSFCLAASEADPNFGEPLAFAALTHLYAILYGWVDPVAGLAECARLGMQALSREPNSPVVLALHSAVCAQTGRLEEAQASARKSVEINPSSSRGHYALGYACYLTGDAEGAVRAMQTSIRLSPNDELLPTMLAVLSGALLMTGDFEGARRAAVSGIERAPDFPANYRSLANALARLNRLDEGRAMLGRFLSLAPGMTPSVSLRTMGFCSEALFETWAQGLRRLGWSD
jgi:TolB-like protein